ncbi:MAG: FtsX-like permease family protein [candidate division Zixibacteria bacterium]|nr:FtsX-like permease family protein [candidate division Zixibacteria bacterium]
MILNYLKIALRNLLRHKVYSLINIVGLAIGIAACVLILLFIQRELSFDNMHSDAERIYRVLTIDKALGTNNQRVGITMPALGKALPGAFPEVEDALRLGNGGKTLFHYGDDKAIYAKQVRYSDPNFFEFFDFELIQGDPSSALNEPFSIILTESLAQKIFGDEEAFGKTVRTDNGKDLKITGILRDLPENTHLEFDALGPISTQEALAKERQPEGSTQPIWLEQWQMIAMPTYVRFLEGVLPEGFDEKFTQLTRDNGVGENFDITLQPILDVHLESTDVIFDIVANKGDISNVYIFMAVAFLILLIATVNYMNLSTARSTERAREVGLRKVVGSGRTQLIAQFLGESLVITLIALFLAEPIALLVLPWINDLGGMTLSLNIAENSALLSSFVILFFFVGILAGLYPAFVLSGFKPISVLRGSFKSGKRGTTMRKALVVFQFSLSIALICLTFIIQSQMSYIQNKNIGYDRHQVMLFEMNSRAMGEKIDLYRDALLEHSTFASAATAGNVPGRTFGRTRVRPEGEPEENIWIWSRLSISPEFIPTLDMDIVEGRNFSREMTTDTSGVVLINETAVKKLGWEEPLSKKLYFGDQDSVGVQIVGIVGDFHFIELHQNIEPVVIFPLGSFTGNILAARIQQGRIPEAVEYAEQKWNEIYPNSPFSFIFMDDEFDGLYRRDKNMGKIINIFSGLNIFIACLGLFGLASHSTTQRLKEIGVRKVLGASTGRIIRTLVLDFVRWVVLSNIIAWPVAWYAASYWLQGFAYKIEMNAIPFILAGIITILIAVLTVLNQSWYAATRNPVESLRYE